MTMSRAHAKKRTADRARRCHMLKAVEAAATLADEQKGLFALTILRAADAGCSLRDLEAASGIPRSTLSDMLRQADGSPAAAAGSGQGADRVAERDAGGKP